MTNIWTTTDLKDTVIGTEHATRRAAYFSSLEDTDRWGDQYKAFTLGGQNFAAAPAEVARLLNAGHGLTMIDSTIRRDGTITLVTTYTVG